MFYQSCGKLQPRQRILLLYLRHLADEAEPRARLDESETDNLPVRVSVKSAQGFREGQTKVFGKIHKRPEPKACRGSLGGTSG